MASLDNGDFYHEDADSISKTENPKTASMNVIYSVRCNEISEIFVKQILETAIDNVLESSEKHCETLDKYSVIKNLKGITSHRDTSTADQLCSTSDTENQNIGLISSPLTNKLQPIVAEFMSAKLNRNFKTLETPDMCLGRSYIDNFEKLNFSNSITNKVNTLVVPCDDSTLGKFGSKTEWDFSILKNVLSDDCFSSHPNNLMLSNYFIQNDIVESFSFPKINVKGPLTITHKMAVKNDVSRESVMEDVGATRIIQSNVESNEIIDILSSNHCYNNLRVYSDQSPICSEFFYQTKNLQNKANNIANMSLIMDGFSKVTSNPTKTINLINESKTEKLPSNRTPVAHLLPLHLLTHYTKYPKTRFTPGGTRTVPLSEEMFKNEFNSAQCDKEVEISSMEGLLQSSLKATTCSSFKAELQKSSIRLDLSSSCENVSKHPESNKFVPTNNFVDRVSSELFQIFTLKSRKTLRPNECDIDIKSNNSVPYKLDEDSINTIISVSRSSIQNQSTCGTSEIKALSSDLKHHSEGLSCSERAQSNASVFSNEMHYPRNSECGDLFELSDSSWSESDHVKENVDVGDGAMENKVEDMVIIKPNDLTAEHNDVEVTEFNDSDIDELDKIIDDSIKKYENFTVDASTYATPSTAEKSCQTETIDIRDIARCKRCLDFEDQSTSISKKLRFDSNKDFDYNLVTKSDKSTNYNDLSVSDSVEGEQPHKDNQMISKYKEKIQSANFRSLANSECNNSMETTHSLARLPIYDSIDEVYDLNDEESLFVREENKKWDQANLSIESFCDSDQEVPIIQSANIEDMDDDSEVSDSPPEDVFWGGV